MCGHIRLHRKGLCFVSDPGTGYVSLIWGPLPQGVQRHLAVCISCHRLEGYAGLFCVVLREVAWCLPCVPLCVQKGGTSLRDGSLLQDCFATPRSGHHYHCALAPVCTLFCATWQTLTLVLPRFEFILRASGQHSVHEGVQQQGYQRDPNTPGVPGVRDPQKKSKKKFFFFL